MESGIVDSIDLDDDNFDDLTEDEKVTERENQLQGFRSHDYSFCGHASLIYVFFRLLSTTTRLHCLRTCFSDFRFLPGRHELFGS